MVCITRLFVGPVGLIVDVYANERESLGKVIVFPFFVIALVSSSTVSAFVCRVWVDFPIFPLLQMQHQNIIYSTIIGIVSAIYGVITQFFVNRKMTKIGQREII